jgi:putative two-component system response regulator
MRRQYLRARYIASFVVAETACAAVAFWILHQLVVEAIATGASRVTAAGLSDSLLIYAACILAWLSILMAVIAYLSVSQIFEHFGRVQQAADADALVREQSLMRAHDAIIVGLAKLAESRDDDTGRHLERISAYACRLAVAANCHPRFRDQISAEFIDLLRISAPMHDIGKVGIPDSILLKPGPLTADERAEMEQHTTIGGNCLLEVEQRLEGSDFLQMARDIVLAHHERWDGTGYPAGLAGEAIPLAARITSIADVYDALSSDRVYRKKFSHAQCVAMIEREAGKQFDPNLVEVFLAIQQSFQEIAELYGNGKGHPADSFRLPVRLFEGLPAEMTAVASVTP